jgi:two-component system nitrogen regulation sensor histidine kinase NtrY
VILYREGHRRITFDLMIDEGLPQLVVDRDQIKRAVINIVDNAVHAIDGQGRIDVRVRREADDRRVAIEIADTGGGLPAAYRKRLFEPYFSTKKMGTGLGLAIVHRIVTDHGGEITLHDNQPRGTIVTIALPVRAAEEPKPKAEA